MYSMLPQKIFSICFVLLCFLTLVPFMAGCNTPPPVTATTDPTFLDEPGVFTAATLDTKIINDKGTYPVTIYFPGNGTGQYPAIAFSPGLGANKDMYRWVGNHLASHGYTILLFTVPLPFTTSTSQNEAGFVSAFELLEAENNNLHSPLYGLVNLSRRAVMGHSLGGSASFRAAGAMEDLDAVIALAPAPVNVDADLIAVTEPTQIQTATRDCITGDDLAYSYYKLLSSDTKQIIDINGGNHVAFIYDVRIVGEDIFDCTLLIDKVNQHQRLSRRYFTAWLDYYLKDDSAVEPHLFGKYAEQDLLSEVLTMWEFVRP